MSQFFFLFLGDRKGLVMLLCFQFLTCDVSLWQCLTSVNVQKGDICDGIDMDNVALSFDNSEDLLSYAQQRHPKCNLDSVSLDSLLMERNQSFGESNIHLMENALEVIIDYNFLLLA